MRTTNIIAAASVLLLALFYIWSGSHFPVMSRVGIGPGMFPWAIGVLLVILSSLWLITSIRSIPADIPQPFGTFKADLEKPIIIMVLLVVMVTLTPSLGFVLAGTAMTFVLYYWVERKPLLISTALAVFFPAAFYTIFSTALGVKVPKGILGW